MQGMYDKVIAYIKTNGPSLPIQIAKVMEKDTFYAGAILSDLLAKKALKVSTAKIGGSPLYYLPEQQSQLSKLYDHLPLREKEAYDLLKEKKVVKDDDMQPAIRVAFQMLKDFAVPFEYQSKKMWKWYLATDEEAKKILEPVVEAPVQQHLPEHVQHVDIQQKLSKPSKQLDDFAPAIAEYLVKNKIVVTERLSQRKNKEMIALVKIPSAVGELEMLLIAKNKKKITNSDLSLIHQKSQAKKLPALFLTTGEISKKTEQHLEKNLKGLLILRRL